MVERKWYDGKERLTEGVLICWKLAKVSGASYMILLHYEMMMMVGMTG